MSDLQSISTKIFNKHLAMHLEILNDLANVQGSITSAAELIFDAFQRENKILLCGNGGSASDAQHIAAELIGRYKIERRALPAIALNTDTSAITAIGNDYGYVDVFKRQFQGLYNKGDVLIVFSTSGKSPNIISLLNFANEIGAKSICFTGENANDCSALSTLSINIPSNITAHIQEMHIMCGHIICDIIDNLYSS